MGAKRVIDRISLIVSFTIALFTFPANYTIVRNETIKVIDHYSNISPALLELIVAEIDEEDNVLADSDSKRNYSTKHSGIKFKTLHEKRAAIHEYEKSNVINNKEKIFLKSYYGNESKWTRENRYAVIYPPDFKCIFGALLISAGIFFFSLLLSLGFKTLGRWIAAGFKKDNF